MKRMITPLAIAATLIGAPVMADSDHISSKQLLSALTSEPTKIWVRATQSVYVDSLARDLGIPESQIVELNEFIYGGHSYIKAGDWVVLPETSVESISASTALDGTEIRDTPPLKMPPAPVDVVEIKPEQSLMSLVRDHGITLTQLESFNPGVELSKLVPGSRVRVAKASVLSVRPLRSSTTPIGTSYTAPDSEQKQAIRDRIQHQRKQERIAAARRADALRVARLRREEARRKRYLLIGGCTYDWQSWGKSPSGVRSVKAAHCSGVSEVAVDCNNTKISKLKWSKWRGWEVPSAGFEDLVVETCANVLGAGQPRYIDQIVAPEPTPRDVLQVNRTKKCTGPAILCRMP